MESYLPRKAESVLADLARQFPAVAVTGPRQSGKTTLIRHLFPKMPYVTLDDPLTRQQAVDDPEQLLDAENQGLVIDEIQYAPELLSSIKMRIDADRKRKGRFVLTGSQQFNLMKGLGESLAGRVGLLELPPLTVSEALPVWKGASAQELFTRACLRGLYPELVADPALKAGPWYAAYLQTYLERDIRSVYDIGSLREFERFLQLLAGRCAQLLNLSALAGETGVAVNTIRRWISVLEACGMIRLLPPWFSNLGKRVVKTPKVYFMDCGLVCFLTRLRDAGHLMAGPMAGALFENFCVQEAVKASFSEDMRPQFFFYRDKEGLEVDLIVEGADQTLHPYEFKLSKTPRAGMADALVRFRKIHAGLHPSEGAVVSLSEKTGGLAQGVRLMSAMDFVMRDARVRRTPSDLCER
jgi:predicted AAA+ superfamily ATPase